MARITRKYSYQEKYCIPGICQKDKNIMHSLHIKLQFIKQFVKVMNKECEESEYLIYNFPGTSNVKLS